MTQWNDWAKPRYASPSPDPITLDTSGLWMGVAMGKPQGEACMSSGRGCVDAAAVGLCNGPRDGQAQAASIGVRMGTRGVGAKEAIKQAGQDFGINILPRVLHRY